MESEIGSEKKEAGSRRRGRPFRHRPNLALTRELILETSLQIVRKQELASLTVQNVSDALDVSRSPIYSIFATGEALRAAVLDHVFVGQLSSQTPDSISWQDKLRIVAFRVFDTYDAYPGIASELFRTGFPDTEAGRRAAENVVEILKEAGFRSTQIPSLILAVTALAVGSVMQIHGAREREKQLSTASKDELEAFEKRRGGTLPPELLGRDHYNAALEVLVRGMESTLSEVAPL